jgi:hypothetical protein
MSPALVASVTHQVQCGDPLPWPLLLRAPVSASGSSLACG